MTGVSGRQLVMPSVPISAQPTKLFDKLSPLRHRFPQQRATEARTNRRGWMTTGSSKNGPLQAAERLRQVDCLVDARCAVAQSLTWDRIANRLFWLDAPAGQLFAVSLDSGVVQTWRLPCPAWVIALATDGRILVVLVDGVYLFNLQTHDLHFLAALDAAASFRGGPDHNGTFWLTPQAGPGAALGLTADGSLTPAPFAAPPSPDQRAFDAEGAYWSCGPGSVTRFAPDGRTLTRIALPVPTPTSCCFGGATMRLLLIGSQRDGLDAATLRRSPGAGGIFMVPVQVAGVPVRRFAD